MGTSYPRCSYCGRYIGASEFDRDEIIVDFTPDTQFTTEKIEHIHKRCKKILHKNIAEDN